MGRWGTFQAEGTKDFVNDQTKTECSASGGPHLECKRPEELDWLPSLKMVCTVLPSTPAEILCIFNDIS